MGMFRVISGGVLSRPIATVADNSDVDWVRDLYNRHSDYVRGVVVSHGGPEIEAEDLVQEVFLAAHRKIRILRSYSEPRAWLHLAALREVWKVRRRIRVQKLLPFGAILRGEERPAPDAVYAQNERVRWLYQMLDELPHRQREALILFHIEGLNSAEIGRLLGCPEETIRSRVFHGRRKLLSALDRQRRPGGVGEHIR
jgi:RNA polymerase sigma factor (sigma-70 family)